MTSPIMPAEENDRKDDTEIVYPLYEGITHRRRMRPNMVPYVSLNSSPPSSPSTVERRHHTSSVSYSPTNNNFSPDFKSNRKTSDPVLDLNNLIEFGVDNETFVENNDLNVDINKVLAAADESGVTNQYSLSNNEIDVVKLNNVQEKFSSSDESFHSSKDTAPLLPVSKSGGDELEMSLFTSHELTKDVSMVLAKSPHVENAWTIGVQVFIPFLIAGCGTVGAGLVLDIVQHWQVFTEVPQIFILIPALLGLKGNLEMTLASRLSTLAHLGRMDTKSERIKQIVGNLALIQAQAAVVAFLAAVFAIVLGWVPKGAYDWNNAFLLCASGLATASLASFVLGSVMVLVVILSRHFHINPDNVATPIAASLGDLTTLALLSLISSVLNGAKEKEFWVAPLVVAFFILLCPLWIWISSRNPVTREVLISGWSPVIFSMLISSAGGFILEFTVARFRGIAVFQPVINGIGGNLVAVQASRLSTSLHQSSRLGVLPATSPKTCHNPCETFCGKRRSFDYVNSTAARVLLFLVVPGHLIFMYMINFLRAGHTTITFMFAFVYLSAAVIQVTLLLYICDWMVHSMWKRKIDPDNSAIPYLTALGDLLGTALLAIAFHLLYRIGDRDSDLGE